MSAPSDKPKLSADAQQRRFITGLSHNAIARLHIDASTGLALLTELRRVCVEAEARHMALMPEGIIRWIDDHVAAAVAPDAAGEGGHGQ